MSSKEDASLAYWLLVKRRAQECEEAFGWIHKDGINAKSHFENAQRTYADLLAAVSAYKKHQLHEGESAT